MSSYEINGLFNRCVKHDNPLQISFVEFADPPGMSW